MSYLIMEVRVGYVVVLDEAGRVFKAANFGYQIGDVVKDVVLMNEPKRHSFFSSWSFSFKQAGVLVTSFALIALFYLGYFQPNYSVYGTLRLQINPDVVMSLSKTQRVLKVEGLNEDGLALIEGYSFADKKSDEVASELIERAIDQGYLSERKTLTIEVDSNDVKWTSENELSVSASLDEKYGNRLIIEVSSHDNDDDRVEIPSKPAQPTTPPSNNHDDNDNDNDLNNDDDDDHDDDIDDDDHDDDDNDDND